MLLPFLTMKARLIKKFEDELMALDKELKTELPQEIRRARELGDLRENAEYHAAKERQRLVEARISLLKKRVSDIHHDEHRQDPARQGGVRFDRSPQGRRVRRRSPIYQLVMPEDADVEHGLISTASPIGRAMLNKEEGDEVTVTTPSRQPAVRAGEALHHPRRGVTGSNSAARQKAKGYSAATCVSAAALRDYPDSSGPPLFHASADGGRPDGLGHGRRLPRRRACARCTRPVSARISSPAAAWARSARCSPRSTAAPGLWEPSGIWKSGAARRFYQLARGAAVAARRPARGRRGAAVPAAAVRDRDPGRPRRLSAHAGGARRRRRSALTVGVQRPAAAAGSLPGGLPLIVPRLVLLAVVVAAGAVGGQPGRCRSLRARASRRARGGLPVAADRQPAVFGADASRRSRRSSGP